MKLKIEVTAEDIQNGMPGWCGKCPVALAVRRALGGFVKREVASVGVSYAAVYVDSRIHMLPSDARMFVQNFDEGEPVEPFDFEIEV
jgi:hypothetical protein